MKLYHLYIFIFLFWNTSQSQDPIFSQFYTNYLQLNPALTGNTYSPLVQVSYRNQWPGLGNVYNTYAVSYDQLIDKYNSGVGLRVLSDNAATGTLVNTGLVAFYSYRVRVKKDLYMKCGLELGYHSITLDWNKLTFGDNLDSRGISSLPTKEQLPEGSNIQYFNLGGGIALYSPQYYFGLALKNVNSPSIDFLQLQNNSTNTNIPTRISIHGGYKKTLRAGNKNKPETFISPNIMFQSQRSFFHINAGIYASHLGVIAGVWYSHTIANQNAIITSLGYSQDFWKIIYSYDATLSRLSFSNGGAHEIGLSLNFDHLVPKKINYNDCFAIFR